MGMKVYHLLSYTLHYNPWTSPSYVNNVTKPLDFVG